MGVMGRRRWPSTSTATGLCSRTAVFTGGQDTLLANGNGKRQYFSNCYIDGNTDFIFGSAIAIFDSCVIYPRDRVDGSSGGYLTAANTPAGQAYGYVFSAIAGSRRTGALPHTPWAGLAE